MCFRLGSTLKGEMELTFGIIEAMEMVLSFKRSLKSFLDMIEWNHL